MRLAALILLPLLAAAASLPSRAAVVLDTVTPGAPERLALHLRVKPAGAANARAELRWNVADSTADYNYATVVCERCFHEEWGTDATLVTGRCIGGCRIEDSSADLSLDGDVFDLGLSLKLTVAGGAATVCAGARMASKPVAVPWTSTGGVRLQAEAAEADSVVRCELRGEYKPEPRMAPFGSVDLLMSYLAASVDPCEGLWVYYDSETSPLKARLGGRYTLATAANPEGGYDVIYLRGASEDAHLWPPLRVKGRLLPTPFVGFFDLRWLSPGGAEAVTHADAEITQGLLKLNFPYWKAAMRFARKNIN